MAASKDPSAYPAAFQMLVEHFKDQDAPSVSTYYERAASAARFRFNFYNFKKALKVAGDEGNLRVAQGIILKLSPTDAHGGATLEFSLRDNADYALDLEAAIMRAKGLGSESPTGRLSPYEPPAAGKEPGANAQGSHDDLIDGFMAAGSGAKASGSGSKGS